MSILDNAQMAYTFDDFMLVPVHSEIKSRKDPDISVKVPGFEYNIPIVASPMNTVTEEDMVYTMCHLGGVGVLHRYMSIEDQVDICKRILTRLSDARTARTTIYEVEGYNTPQGFVKYGSPADLPGPYAPVKPDFGPGPTFYAAVGANGDRQERVQALLATGVGGICVDVANGHNTHCIQAVKDIRALSSTVKIMAGNVCTYEGARDLAEAGADSIRIGIGPGCFGAGTRILMANGTYKNIEDVRPGDRIINKNGEPINVKNSWCTGRRKVRKLRHTQFYKETVATSDHKFWAADINHLSEITINARGFVGSMKNAEYKWKKLEELDKDVILAPRNINFELAPEFKIELYKRNIGLEYTLKPSWELGYIFGTFLGDGCSKVAEYKNSKRGSVSWYFGKNESLVAERTAECLWRLFGKKAKIVNKKNMKVVNFHYKPFADFLQQFGKRTEKHLPSWLLTNNKEYLKWLQIGLIDSDGQIDSTDRTRFDNTSSELIELFGVINKILTCAFPNYMAKEKSIGNLDNVCLENIKQSYRIDILKTADKRLNEYYQAIKTLEIGNESQEEIDVYDIEVDCPTHSFIANNAIVHNSMCTTRLVTGHGVPQLSAIEDCARVKANYPHGLGETLRPT